MGRRAVLTEMQKSFIEHYAANGCNGADAARKAGYSVKAAGPTAQKLLKKPLIKAAVLERQQAMERERIADIEEIKKYWTSVMRGQETEICHNKKGEEYERKVRTVTRLKAAEALAKSQGAFLKGNMEKEKLDFNIIWVDDYGEDEDYDSDEG